MTNLGAAQPGTTMRIRDGETAAPRPVRYTFRVFSKLDKSAIFLFSNSNTYSDTIRTDQARYGSFQFYCIY